MRLEEDAKAPSGHGLVIFADSPAVASCPEGAASQADGGIRFHRSAAVETRDAVQAFGGLRILQAATTTTLTWNYAAKRIVAASVPTNHDFGGEDAPRLESYRPARAYAYTTAEQAARAATLAPEAIEVRNKSWIGRSTEEMTFSWRRNSQTELTGQLDAHGHPRRAFILRNPPWVIEVPLDKQRP